MPPRVLARLAAVFLLGLVLFLPPLVSLPRTGTVFGVPALPAYLFLAWGGLIAALGLVLACRGDSPER